MLRTKLVGDSLDDAGLNLHAVFDLASLPDPIISTLDNLCKDLNQYKQLILIGHGGRRMWEKVQTSLTRSSDPIDDYSKATVSNFCHQRDEIGAFRIIYPGDSALGLQSLGELAGWHHTTPFRVGINEQWGSWFAYRAVVLSDSALQETPVVENASPCESCVDKPCISACPADALGKEFSLQKCLHYRKRADSLCKDRCLARMRCPIAQHHQYALPQIKYHYGVSMKMIKALGL